MPVMSLLPQPPASRPAVPGFDDLVRAHREPLLRYIMSFTGGDGHLAEDILQETLLRAWRHLVTTSGDVRLARAFLVTVARNLLCDQHRRRQTRVVEVALSAEDDNQLPTGPDRIAETIAAHDMAGALNRLSAEHRALLIEVYYHDRRLVDAADLLGVPLGTAKSRMHYALRALRRIATELDLGTAAPPELPRAA